MRQTACGGQCADESQCAIEFLSYKKLVGGVPDPRASRVIYIRTETFAETNICTLMNTDIRTIGQVSVLTVTSVIR